MKLKLNNGCLARLGEGSEVKSMHNRKINNELVMFAVTQTLSGPAAVITLGLHEQTLSSLRTDVPEQESFNLVKIKIPFHDLTVTELSLKAECPFSR